MKTERLRQFLAARRILVTEADSEALKQHGAVVPWSDVSSALQMIDNNEFDVWLDKMEALNPYFLKEKPILPSSRL